MRTVSKGDVVGTFSVIVKTDCETDGSFYSTSLHRPIPLLVEFIKIGKVTNLKFCWLPVSSYKLSWHS